MQREAHRLEFQAEGLLFTAALISDMVRHFSPTSTLFTPTERQLWAVNTGSGTSVGRRNLRRSAHCARFVPSGPLGLRSVKAVEIDVFTDPI